MVRIEDKSILTLEALDSVHCPVCGDQLALDKNDDDITYSGKHCDREFSVSPDLYRAAVKKVAPEKINEEDEESDEESNEDEEDEELVGDKSKGDEFKKADAKPGQAQKKSKDSTESGTYEKKKEKGLTSIDMFSDDKEQTLIEELD